MHQVTHYSLWSVCISFVAACKLEWSYDCDLFEADYSELKSDVTCPECQKWISDDEQNHVSFEDKEVCNHEGTAKTQTSGQTPA